MNMKALKLSPDARQRYKEKVGFTDEQLDKLTPNQIRHFNAFAGREQYLMIAECVWSQNCTHHAKKGDKFVFKAGGRLLPEETTFPGLCLWAMARFLPFVHIIYDRIDQGLDPSPVGFDHVRCADEGIEFGGVGQCCFRIYCEKVSATK